MSDLFLKHFRAHFNVRRGLGLIIILSVCVKKFMPHIERQLYDVWPKPILRMVLVYIYLDYPCVVFGLKLPTNLAVKIFTMLRQSSHSLNGNTSQQHKLSETGKQKCSLTLAWPAGKK